MHCTIRKVQKKNGRDNSRDKTLLVVESTKPFRHFFLKIWVVSVQEPSFRGQRRECADLSDAGWERSGKGSPISWVNWQVWCWMNQHFMWQWKAWSSLAFGRLLWVSSLGVQAFAWDIKGAVVILSPQIPWHHSPARHSCQGALCSSPAQFPRNVCVWKCLLCCLTYTLNNNSLRTWRTASAPGVCSLKNILAPIL